MNPLDLGTPLTAGTPRIPFHRGSPRWSQPAAESSLECRIREDPHQFCPPALPVVPARASQWPPGFKVARTGTRHRGQRPAGSPGRQPRLPLSLLDSPGLQDLAPPPSSLTNLLAGRQEGAAVSGGGPSGGECAPLGGAGRRGAGAALLRPRGEWAQPDAAQLCPRCRRRRRALADMLSFRTCPRGSYQEPAAAGETDRSRGAPRAGGYHAGGGGSHAPLKIAPAEAARTQRAPLRERGPSDSGCLHSFPLQPGFKLQNEKGANWKEFTENLRQAMYRLGMYFKFSSDSVIKLLCFGSIIN
nr:uncharacterized protein LOC103237713 [Chlorocebus sabaeus]